jgi:hypothetical protein
MAPLWGMPSDTMAGRSGLSGNMKVGNIAELALDDRVALRVRFDTPERSPPQSECCISAAPYFATFDGREWHPTRMREDSTRARAPHGPACATAGARARRCATK